MDLCWFRERINGIILVGDLRCEKGSISSVR